jgi:Ca2+/Na+ antiporter
MDVTAFVREHAAVLLLAGAAAGWYVASLVAMDALAGGKLALQRRVLGQWIPILSMALIATLAQRTEIAVGVLFASSVAALSLVLGIVTLSCEFSARPAAPGGFPVIETGNPHVVEISGPADPGPFRARRLWAFVLPVALIAMLAGFTGRLTAFHAVALLIQGLVIFSLWAARNEFRSIDILPEASPQPPAGTGRRVVEILLAIVLALLASWAGVRATHDVSREIGLLSGGFVAAVLVGPALVLPMIGTGMALARSNLYPAAITSSVGIVLLNLCFGLPLVVGMWYARPLWEPPAERMTAMLSPRHVVPSTGPIATDLSPAAPGVRYPLPVWRVDTVILILLGLVLLPLAVGRWLPGKLEGVLLIFVYVVYMGLSTWAARA